MRTYQGARNFTKACFPEFKTAESKFLSVAKNALASADDAKSAAMAATTRANERAMSSFACVSRVSVEQ